MTNHAAHTIHWTTSEEMVFSPQSKYALRLPNTFPLAVNFYQFSAIHPIVPNYHDFHEISYFVSGKGTYHIADQNFAVRPGSVVFVPAGQMHTLEINTDYPLKSASVYFMPELVYHPGSNPVQGFYLLPFQIRNKKPPMLHETELNISVWRFILDMHREIFAAGDFYQLALKNELCDFLLVVLRAMKRKNMITGVHAIQNKTMRLKNVLAFIHQNYTEAIPLEKLAALATMSPAYFSRFFKKVTGFSPINYVSRYRIDRAKGLLADPDLSITEIAFRVGFSSQSYFNRTFQNYTGMNPGRFRRLLLTAPDRKNDD